MGFTKRAAGSPLKELNTRNPRDLQMSDLEHSSTLDVGGMTNLDDHWAVGGTLFFDANAGLVRGGVKPRVRRWLSRKIALELSAGPLLAGGGPENVTVYRLSRGKSHLDRTAVMPIFPAWVTEASLNISDYAALTTRYEVQRWQTVGTDQAWFVGWKCGSYAGVAAVVSAALFVVVLSSLSLSPAACDGAGGVPPRPRRALANGYLLARSPAKFFVSSAALFAKLSREVTSHSQTPQAGSERSISVASSGDFAASTKAPALAPIRSPPPRIFPSFCMVVSDCRLGTIIVSRS